MLVVNRTKENLRPLLVSKVQGRLNSRGVYSCWRTRVDACCRTFGERMRSTFHLSLAVGLCVSAVLSQQGADKVSGPGVSSLGEQPSKSQVGKPPLPQPSPEIERLVKAFSGAWSIALKIEPNESKPKGGRGQGEEVWKPGPGGLSLIEDYHSMGDEGEIYGLGVAWWDK